MHGEGCAAHKVGVVGHRGNNPKPGILRSGRQDRLYVRRQAVGSVHVISVRFARLMIKERRSDGTPRIRAALSRLCLGRLAVAQFQALGSSAPTRRAAMKSLSPVGSSLRGFTFQNRWSKRRGTRRGLEPLALRRRESLALACADAGPAFRVGRTTFAVAASVSLFHASLP